MNRVFRIVAVLAAVAVLAWLGRDQLGSSSGDETPNSKPTTEKQSGFAVLRGARLAKHRNNDGDSFHVTHEGESYEFRLYFVDAPESRYKTYRGGENNGKRLDDQARSFGMTDRDRVAGIGRDAKAFTLGELSGGFSVYTTFEVVFGGARFYAFVKPNGTDSFLHEQLVDRGLARIHTKGVDRPDGVSRGQAKQALKRREAKAKEQRVGGWKALAN